jgi:hypothetical protein
MVGERGGRLKKGKRKRQRLDEKEHFHGKRNRTEI